MSAVRIIPLFAASHAFHAASRAAVVVGLAA
jgi:hypothetical protein